MNLLRGVDAVAAGVTIIVLRALEVAGRRNMALGTAATGMTHTFLHAVAAGTRQFTLTATAMGRRLLSGRVKTGFVFRAAAVGTTRFAFVRGRSLGLRVTGVAVAGRRRRTHMRRRGPGLDSA